MEIPQILDLNGNLYESRKTDWSSYTISYIIYKCIISKSNKGIKQQQEYINKWNHIHSDSRHTAYMWPPKWKKKPHKILVRWCGTNTNCMSASTTQHSMYFIFYVSEGEKVRHYSVAYVYVAYISDPLTISLDKAEHVWCSSSNNLTISQTAQDATVAHRWPDNEIN